MNREPQTTYVAAPTVVIGPDVTDLFVYIPGTSGHYLRFNARALVEQSEKKP